jgi:serine/threonine protein kinase
MNVVVNHKYKIVEPIANGAFGSVFKAINMRTNELVAVKVEPIIHNLKLLKNETIIYNYLKNVKGIPSVKWYGTDGTNYYMVLNLLGNSLQRLKDDVTTFSLNLVFQIGIKVLELLKTIHDKGLVHRDIKPDNFLFGLQDLKTTLHIVDFGLCKPFIENEMHIECKKTAGLIGSHSYASVNAHNHYELSRRDDLESVCYMLVYLLIGTLDWQHLPSNKTDHIKALKMNIVQNPSIPTQLIDYINYVWELEFDETPDYELLVQLLHI